MCVGLLSPLAPKPRWVRAQAEMPPKKLSTNKIGATPPASQRGGDSQRSARKKGATTPKKASKKKVSAPSAALDTVAEDSPAEATAAVLEPVGDTLAPLQAVLQKLEAEATTMQSRLEELGPIEGESEAPASERGATAPGAEDANKAKERLARHKNALLVWKSFAHKKLSEMASSLDAALASDDKLRQLFDHVDTDLGGSIDQNELFDALKAAGKKVSRDTVEHMFHAADEDGNGDIDFSEFADVIKGVKAAKAAFVIERGVRRHQSNLKGPCVKARLSKEEARLPTHPPTHPAATHTLGRLLSPPPSEGRLPPNRVAA